MPESTLGDNWPYGSNDSIGSASTACVPSGCCVRGRDYVGCSCSCWESAPPASTPPAGGGTTTPPAESDPFDRFGDLVNRVFGTGAFIPSAPQQQTSAVTYRQVAGGIPPVALVALIAGGGGLAYWYWKRKKAGG